MHALTHTLVMEKASKIKEFKQRNLRVLNKKELKV